MELPRRQVPIYVAALKQKSIETIGELADGWIPTFWPYQNLKDGMEWIKTGADREQSEGNSGRSQRGDDRIHTRGQADAGDV